MRRRRDGVLVAHHDRPDAPGAPLLADVLALAAASRVDLNLDLKAGGIELQLIELVRAAGLTGHVTCTGGNWAMLAGIHRAEPGIRAGLTMPRHKPPLGLYQLQRLWYAWRAPRMLEEYDAQLVSCSRRLVSRLLVHRLHRAGDEIWVWTVDRPRRSTRLRSSASTASAPTTRTSHGWV